MPTQTEDSRDEHVPVVDTEAEHEQLSCEEVAELILLNKPVPGVKKIPDNPLGLGPEHSSETHISYRKKPWEM